MLVPIYRGDGGHWRVVLVRRAARGVHAGEIAFPGGKPEPGDCDLAATAVREAAEETGLAPSRVRMLSALPVVETRSSRFAIHPFLAHIEPPSTWLPDTHEIAAVLSVAARELRTPAAQARRRVPGGAAREFASTPCFRLRGVTIWGATFRILAPLVPLLARPGLRWLCVDGIAPGMKKP